MLLDVLAGWLMNHHAHFVIVSRQEKSLACTFRRRALNLPWRLAGNLWQERFHSYPMDERKGLGSLVKSSSRSLFSPPTIFGQIRLTRRSIQSQAAI
jgi:hypothetical protein